MKTNKKTLLVVLALVLALAALASPALAQAPWTPFSGTETLFAPTDMGKMEFVDGKVIISGMVQPGVDQTNDPRTSGEVTVVVNAAWSLPEQLGPMWGTLRLVNEQGEWNGTWTGSRRLVDGNIISDIRGTGRGSGAYEGLIGKWSYLGVNAGPTNPYEQISGMILEPGQ